ncbi:kielin/chordin-like protein isoform X1 [Bolinopsis microptera]|uniref:kielin/chordin-like protein isoform X1 n=2 Tax=Bolinopsis microptera TaxID=2820187 RepID=UPI00307B03E1
MMDCPDSGECDRRIITPPDQCCPICPEHCVDNDGKEYGQGETWSPDPCTHCTCEVNEDTGEKQEMCAVMDCEDPAGCNKEMIRIPDQCCPICPEHCVDTDGKEYGQGETWSPDPCTHCTCEVNEDTGEKQEMCAVSGCAWPGECPWDTITPDDHCCPICPCTNPETGETHKVGEGFQADPCTHCTCMEKGILQCDMIMCDIPNCLELNGGGWRMWNKPGSCCPGCIGPCSDDTGKEFEVGESWKRTSCKECKCIDKDGGKMEICDDICETKCQRFVIHGQDFICLDDYNCDAVKCAAPDLYSRTYADKCCTHSIPDECGLEDCASLDCNYKDAVYISTSPCCPICVILTPPTEVPPPTESPDECALVDCPAPPKCVTGYPVTFEGDCCASCKPDYCNAVDCMPVHPNCESVYTSKSPCCPVCKDPPVCPEGEDMALCFSDPCTATKCRNYPYAECKASFCGECTAIFYDENGDVITNCEGDCLDGQLIKECGSACTPTCENPLPACTKNCVRRCECLFARSILYKQSCIPENECPDYLPFCDEIYSDEDSDGDIDFAQTSSSGSSSGSSSSSRNTRSVQTTEVTDPDCGEAEVECDEDPCETAKCPNFPYAKCRVDTCGKCQAVFYHDTGSRIDNCKGDCLGNMIFNNCGSACTATCSNPNPVCIEMCVARCECPSDVPLLTGSHCNPRDECPEEEEGNSNSGGGSGEMCRPRYPDPDPDSDSEPDSEPVPPEPECGDIVNCFENPCKVQSCPNYPRARCRANYCGGCNADFYDSSGARISDCEGECKAPKKYTECGSACPQTCFSDPSLPCIAVCVPGCSCPSSAPVLYRGKCIARDMCPAMDEVEAMDESKRLFDDPSETDTIRDSSTSVLSITLTLGILTIVRLVFF